jgi:hypothetical protein
MACCKTARHSIEVEYPEPKVEREFSRFERNSSLLQRSEGPDSETVALKRRTGIVLLATNYPVDHGDE